MRAHHLVFALWLVMAMAGWGMDRFRAWVAATDMPPLMVETGVEIRDRDGLLLRPYTVANGRWRLATTAGAVDPDYLRMLITYEDRRFYRHGGVDFRALGRSLWQAALNGRVVSGGSTLTMQTARLLEEGPTGRIDGKLRQMRVAWALERRLSKTQILDLYLQLAPMGGNIEGVRAASLTYFGKEPRRLSTAEAALLVALPQSPEARRPDRFPDAARIGRDRVLSRVAAAGFLTEEALVAARAEELPDERRAFPQFAAHLADRIVSGAPLGQVHRTTIRREVQASLEALAASAVSGGDQNLQIALMVADYQTGALIVSVGSGGYRADQRLGFLDMTQAVRSPGSTLKPLIYGLGFSDGLIHPETLIEDRPSRFGDYEPQNFDKRFRGTIRIRDALTQSLNIPAVAVLEQLGAARLMNAMRKSGADPVIPGSQPGLAIALGGIGMTLEDLLRIYGTIARGGLVMPLNVVSETADPEPPLRILSPEAAWQVGNILEALPRPRNAPNASVAYKTGTSYGHRDAWAVGFDGRHVVGVWMGRADGTPIPGAFGGDLAAPVLFDAFARLGMPVAALGPPPPATIITSSANLPLPLRRFENRGAAFRDDIDAPKIIFPPDNARVESGGAGLVARLRDGAAPFTWLANGVPILLGSRDRQVQLNDLGRGFVDLTVIDAKGRATRSSFELN